MMHRGDENLANHGTATVGRRVLADISNRRRPAPAIRKPMTRTQIRQAPVVAAPPAPVQHFAEDEDVVMKENRDSNASRLSLGKPLEDLSMTPTITNFQRAPVEPVDPVDANDRNPQMVSEYVGDIVKLWRHKEKKFHVSNNYMGNQPDINGKMRAILVDWLVEVHLKFKLESETLYVCIDLIDRFLAVKMVARAKLQLVGITAMLVACKYQEIYPPEINDFIYISDSAYTQKEILCMEELMLNSLAFNVTTPSALGFAQRWAKVMNRGNDREFQHMMQFLMELSAVDYEMKQYLPSKLAASAATLSMSILNHGVLFGEDESAMLRHSKYSTADLSMCMDDMRELVRNCPTHRLSGVLNKYSHSKFSRVAAKAIDFVQH